MRCFEPFNYILFFFVILCTSVSCNDDEKNEEEIMTLTISPHKEKIHDPVINVDYYVYIAYDVNNNKIVIDRIVDFDDIYEEGYRYVVEVKAVKKHNGKPYEDEIYTYDYYLIRVLEKLKE